MPTEEDEDITIAIHLVTEQAVLGDPYMAALAAELCRLYDAAGERRPIALGGPRRVAPSMPGFLEFLT